MKSRQNDNTEEWHKILAPLGFEIFSTMMWKHTGATSFSQQVSIFDLSASNSPENIIRMVYERGIEAGKLMKQEEIKKALGLNDNT